jgi:putative transposase
LKGRKRHLLVDTLGLLHGLVVHAGPLSERAGAELVLFQAAAAGTGLQRLQRVWCDGGYEGFAQWANEHDSLVVERVERPAGTKGWVVLPKRWIVARTLAWLLRCRRLARDYEYLPESREAWIYLAMSQLMLRRLKP